MALCVVRRSSSSVEHSLFATIAVLAQDHALDTELDALRFVAPRGICGRLPRL